MKIKADIYPKTTVFETNYVSWMLNENEEMEGTMPLMCEEAKVCLGKWSLHCGLFQLTKQ